MRAKYINEKFEEESDPIEDMGIGIVGELNKLINDEYPSGKYNYRNIPLNRLIEDVIYPSRKWYLLDFVLNDKASIALLNGRYSATLGNFVYEEKYEFARYLVKLGADVDAAIENAMKFGLSETLNKLHNFKNNLTKK